MARQQINGGSMAKWRKSNGMASSKAAMAQRRRGVAA